MGRLASSFAKVATDAIPDAATVRPLRPSDRGVWHRLVANCARPQRPIKLACTRAAQLFLLARHLKQGLHPPHHRAPCGRHRAWRERRCRVRQPTSRNSFIPLHYGHTLWPYTTVDAQLRQAPDGACVQCRDAERETRAIRYG